MNRKEFFKTSALGLAAAAAASAPVTLLSSCAEDRKPCCSNCDTPLRISFQEGTGIGESLNEKFDYMDSLGVVGFEPGGRNLMQRVPEIKEALSSHSNISVSAICAGFQGFILAEDPAQKALFDTTMREIVCAAGELGSTGVIMVPAFNSQLPCLPNNQQTWDYLCSELHELGEFALEHGTTVILEPLNRKEAFYMRHVGVAAAIARDSQSKGVKAMGDFWHMKEEASDYGALWSAGPEYLQHVHIASRGKRRMPGEDGELDNYVDGFRALKEMGYKHFVSFECSSTGPREETVPAAVALMREQWQKA